jgi:beta-1,4-N-acetylglucosaminyltransferase
MINLYNLFAASAFCLLLTFAYGVVTLSVTNLSKRKQYRYARGLAPTAEENVVSNQAFGSSKPTLASGIPVDSQRPLHLLVVLGSGGHTTEMLRLLSSKCGLFRDQDAGAPTWVTFVYGRTDQRTPFWRERFQEELPRFWKVVRWEAIPRAREVGQSWATSLLTTLHSILVATRLFFVDKDSAHDGGGCIPAPNILLCNGPGTCIPPCIIAILFRIWNSFVWKRPGRAYPKIIFVETVARVHRLSLTGKILYLFADRFLVQWPELAERYQCAEFYGRLV